MVGCGYIHVAHKDAAGTEGGASATERDESQKSGIIMQRLLHQCTPVAQGKVMVERLGQVEPQALEQIRLEGHCRAQGDGL
jgi:hypothetical protein